MQQIYIDINFLSPKSNSFKRYISNVTLFTYALLHPTYLFPHLIANSDTGFLPVRTHFRNAFLERDLKFSTQNVTFENREKLFYLHYLIHFILNRLVQYCLVNFSKIARIMASTVSSRNIKTPSTFFEGIIITHFINPHMFWFRPELSFLKNDDFYLLEEKMVEYYTQNSKGLFESEYIPKKNEVRISFALLKNLEDQH